MADSRKRDPAPWAVELRRLRKKVGLSQRALGDAAGIHDSYVTGIETGHRGHDPSPELIIALADGLGVSPDAMLRLAGLESPGAHVTRPTFRQVVMGDPLLMEEERETLIRIYESYVKKRRQAPRAQR